MNFVNRSGVGMWDTFKKNVRSRESCENINTTSSIFSFILTPLLAVTLECLSNITKLVGVISINITPQLRGSSKNLDNPRHRLSIDRASNSPESRHHRPYKQLPIYAGIKEGDRRSHAFICSHPKHHQARDVINFASTQNCRISLGRIRQAPVMYCARRVMRRFKLRWR